MTPEEIIDCILYLQATIVVCSHEDYQNCLRYMGANEGAPFATPSPFYFNNECPLRFGECLIFNGGLKYETAFFVGEMLTR